MSREQIEKVLFTDRKAYMEDVPMQTRYRELLEQGGGAGNPGDSAAAAHEAEVVAQLQRELGPRFRDYLTLGAKHFFGLPKAERDGMDDADNIRATLAAAAPIPRGAELGKEIAQIEKAMREDRDAYFKNHAQQARYRILLQARDGS
jgi:hypothetical protein